LHVSSQSSHLANLQRVSIFASGHLLPSERKRQ
jgi:hypothetical protein